MYRIIIPVLLLLVLDGCKPEVHPPKPTGYFKIDTPAAHIYQVFDIPGFPYTFEYPKYAVIETGSVFQGEKADNPYWININIPSLSATVNITYKDINAEQPLSLLVSKAYEMSFFHHNVSDYVDTKQFDNLSGVAATIYSLGGDAATKYQFTATDSTHHFIRGALYFNTTPNADSLQPAYDFVERDILHMLVTMRWKNG